MDRFNTPCSTGYALKGGILAALMLVNNLASTERAFQAVECAG